MRERTEEILRKAYLDTTKKIETGLRVLSAQFEPYFQEIDSCYRLFDEVKQEPKMYEGVYFAAEGYEKVRRIGIDHAFSAIIVELGVSYQSREWYEVMSYHYSCQAAKKEVEE